MDTRRGPREIAEAMMFRSVCNVQVGACIAFKDNVFSWGWNSVGAGYGIHAEAHAIKRANKDRLDGATIYVASRRKYNGKTVTSKPCDKCQKVIDKYGLKVRYRAANGEWV